MISMETGSDWKSKTLIVGAVLGALSGLGAAYLLVQRAERRGEAPQLGAREGIKIGLWVLGLLRQVGELGAGKEE
jgi:hypothetical protein